MWVCCASFFLRSGRLEGGGCVHLVLLQSPASCAAALAETDTVRVWSVLGRNLPALHAMIPLSHLREVRVVVSRLVRHSPQEEQKIKEAIHRFVDAPDKCTVRVLQERG